MNKSGIIFILILFFIFSVDYSYSQNTNYGIEVSKSYASGLKVSKVIVLIKNDSGEVISDEKMSNELLNAASIGVESAFEINVFDFAVNKLRKLDHIKSAEYQLFSPGFSDNLTMVIIAVLKDKGDEKNYESKGMFKNIEDFPVLVENNYSKLSLIITGGAGVYNDINAFFQHGLEFTKGNPIATDPAGPGNSIWMEGNLELGLGGIIQLGKSPVYPYFGISGMMTGAAGQDLYSSLTRGFTDFEKAYMGIIYNISENGLVANLSAGRQNFQLNDGLLFSKYSGSANAGQRASLFLSARTAYEKTAMLKLKYKKFTLESVFLEPEELDFNPSNTQYLINSLDYNDNSSVNAGISLINVINSKTVYANVNDINMPKKGLFGVNPKIWINSINNNKDISLKSEFVYEGNSNFDMGAFAFYVTGGYNFSSLKLSPFLSYRYSYMSGDDSSTVKYERFDPLLTGGLGNWIQGLNFRKVIGNGNIAAHRIHLDLYPQTDMILSLDYFYLWAPELFNLGGLRSISRLPDKNYGQEVTLTYKYYISNKFTLLSIISTAIPGDAVKLSFDTPSKPWTTMQISFFMHIF